MKLDLMRWIIQNSNFSIALYWNFEFTTTEGVRYSKVHFLQIGYVRGLETHIMWDLIQKSQ